MRNNPLRKKNSAGMWEFPKDDKARNNGKVESRMQL
jgi:hypothetical protein